MYQFTFLLLSLYTVIFKIYRLFMYTKVRLHSSVKSVAVCTVKHLIFGLLNFGFHEIPGLQIMKKWYEFITTFSYFSMKLYIVASVRIASLRQFWRDATMYYLMTLCRNQIHVPFSSEPEWYSYWNVLKSNIGLLLFYLSLP